MSSSKIQWFSILNSLVIVLFLSGMIAMILLRTIRKDLIKYNVESEEDAEEENGWKSVHGDVFRPPRCGLLLSVFVGNGIQIAIMSLVTLCMYNVLINENNYNFTFTLQKIFFYVAESFLQNF
jgi:transmembrane 9 superfamily protein 2/4